MKRIFYILLLVLFLAACSSEKTRIYKVEYKGNHPEGAFSAKIGNNTIFTNGYEVLEVHMEKSPKFFCYAVNREVLCKLNINVKINEDSAEEYRAVTQESKELLMKSGKNRSVLAERFAYYIDGEKSEEEALFANNLKNMSIDVLPVAVSGKGTDENKAKKNAMKKYEEIVNLLTDKK